MNIGAYREALAQYVNQALQHSDGTHAGISGYLWEVKVPRFLIKHRNEKLRALEDARQAFDEHRNWPVDVVLSHLGVKPDVG